MSWSNLSLSSDWSVSTGYPAARVRVLSGISNAAQLEGYLTYSGTSLVDIPVTNEGALPAGSYDTSNYHTISGRCYDSVGNPLGTCEILITKDGTLAVPVVPKETVLLFFGDIYPTN